MLLNGERSRIKRDTEEGNIRQVASPGFANGESQHLGDNLSSKDLISATESQKRLKMLRNQKKSTNLTDGDGGVSEEEKLVHAWDEDCPYETDDPSTEGR